SPAPASVDTNGGHEPFLKNIAEAIIYTLPQSTPFVKQKLQHISGSILPNSTQTVQPKFQKSPNSKISLSLLR
ncbi:MAG: hypothetical protein ACYTBJ_22920, partial [Planctomycetota bacterium]